MLIIIIIIIIMLRVILLCVSLMLNYRKVLEMLELTYPTVCACLLTLRPGVLSKTLSHMWDKVNVPMFLFSVGLLTLMNIDSLIFLAKLWH